MLGLIVDDGLGGGADMALSLGDFRKLEGDDPLFLLLSTSPPPRRASKLTGAAEAALSVRGEEAPLEAPLLLAPLMRRLVPTRPSL